MAQHGHGQDDQEDDERRNVAKPPCLMPCGQCVRRCAVDKLCQWVANEAPLFVVKIDASRLTLSNSEHLGTKPGNSYCQQYAKNDRVFRLALDADAVRALYVSAHDCPHHAASKHEARKITDSRITAVHVAVQELQCGWHLVVDLEHGGDAQQDKETEVHHRVHEACCAVAQQGSHVHTSPIVGKALFRVFAGGFAFVWCSALPVTNAVCKAQRSPNQQHWDDRVKSQLEVTGQAFKYFAVNLGFAFPSSDLRNDS